MVCAYYYYCTTQIWMVQLYFYSRAYLKCLLYSRLEWSHRFPKIESSSHTVLFLHKETLPDLEYEQQWRIIPTPGHTDCSISLLLDNGILFWGDAAMNGFSSLFRATIWSDNLKDFSRSWEKIIELKPRKIFPGHGRPFYVSDLSKYLIKTKNLKLYPQPNKAGDLWGR